MSLDPNQKSSVSKISVPEKTSDDVYDNGAEAPVMMVINLNKVDDNCGDSSRVCVHVRLCRSCKTTINENGKGWSNIFVL